ncbi:hypothetical protein PF006_g670 [Phytophthora fragariae]|uniref:DUF659 domain-containing protein n=1 Tax=Phytophthora fragariae TaxID=53985 RepID=A0A6A3UUV7_9STRA|nr:hypothetical protein PF003_g21106 [Phytophthora fragariae]KAE9155358.1 hypothetical protein PF006_g672 [Phytophthora fragariae]KAE9155360.1 hypothetical protein PF006_g670 [Phytophthora fragariae]
MEFNKATHPSLLQALQMLHPGVDIPFAHQLSTTLLNMCYRDFKVKMVHKITGKKCTLYTDGWTDVNGKSVINYVLECEGETYFLESVYTGSTSHDTLFLAADVKKVINAAAERNFSTHKFIHPAVCNRLKDGSVEKLVFIFFNAKNMDTDEITAFDDFEDLAELSSDDEDKNQDRAFEYY